MPSKELDRVYAQIAEHRARHGYSEDRLEVETYREYLGDWDLLDLDGLDVREIELGDCTCRWVWRENADLSRRVVYFHGGGYVGGNWLSHGSLAAALSRETGYPVLFVEYRLAPEHPYPAALQDALSALHHALANGPTEKRLAASLFLAGDSAGGGLSFALALRSSAMIRSRISAICAMGSFFDLDPASSELIGKSGLVRDMAHAYAADTPVGDPLVSPINGSYGGSYRSFPPVLLQIGDKDYLLEDTLRMHRLMEAQGADVELRLWPDMPHVWQKFATYLPEAQEAITEIGAFFRRHA